jgi:hypothetical protein
LQIVVVVEHRRLPDSRQGARQLEKLAVVMKARWIVEKLAAVVKARWLAPTSFLFLLISYHLIFGQFFPTRNGTLGNDYSRILPDLLDGYFWFRSNGVFEPFWFTPAFCGGQPALGAPESGFYSIAQLLTYFVDPLASVYATVLLFASLGFWGFYLLLRSCFNSSRQAAVLGAALFMFNGFFIHRMMIGHFAFHSVMLIPWIAYFLLRPTGREVLTTLLNGAVAGCMMAYGVYSGMVHLLLPCALAVLGIAGIHGLAGRDSPGLTRRALVAALVASGLSVAKLTAALLFLHNFPRSDYALPGVIGFWNALHLLMSALFLSPPNIADQAAPLIGGMQWALDRHEWEYGVTIVPLGIILLCLRPLFSRIQSFRPSLNATQLMWLALIGVVIALPLALNIFTLDWNVFLKRIPLIKSSSNLLRWFVVYIPLVSLSSVLLWDGISSPGVRKNGILVAALTALIFINAATDRNYYQSQGYRPDTIVNAWGVARAGVAQGHIESIGAVLDDEHRILMPLARNDGLATGESPLACSNPIFGYRLEHFPIESLHPGPILSERNGLLNIKNPACYVYPKQNSCLPGDHFTVAQVRLAQAFANYKSYAFRFSAAQKIANLVTLATLAMLAVLLTAILTKRLADPMPLLPRP